MCAIHQPNLLPRLTTLAKLFTADYWIVLDDVQFCRRDFQHRARLAALNDSRRRQWLTIPAHLPHGRATIIREVMIADPAGSRRRLAQMLPHYYASSPHWPLLRERLPAILDLFTTTGKIADIAEASTRLLLDLLGWGGRILRSSGLPARHGRSQRLADLTEATGARGYLCGTGGMTYLDETPFTDHGLTVIPFGAPNTGLWQGGREISAIRALMGHGPEGLTGELRAAAAAHIGERPAA